ncbi:serine hydrolase domain-containing protein [Ureibacillus chungkukjangi]|uniref:CubicO group peptidase (Beta-lactamase class C family) n=1 Tax=Ureibacillus chungkukjangi TaxID=1202712 RepID=A0A318TUX5_9BACL|nr:serine hydrolase domain-containing protein [Ureibacillus chungkukjangi]PYF05725.1 CubicO group peptidase (beta-lactamase class C family) [Ureibacillus chungkukjangi]
MENINIQERMKHYNVQGLSITLINHGQICDTENYGLLEVESNKYVNENSIFSACSISKFLTGMLVMKLTNQGLLDLDEDVNNRLVSWKIPENDLTKNKRVTLRNLLSHQSGIKDPENSFGELKTIPSFPSLVELLDGKTPYCKVPIEVNYEPESGFDYSDAGYCIIQLLLEDVTGKPFHQMMKELIFEPLKMGNSTLDMSIPVMSSEKFSCGHNKNGKLVDGKYPLYPYPASSGLWTTSVDLAKLVIELMDAIKGESKVGISSNAIKDMISSQRGKDWVGLGVFLAGSEKEIEIQSLGWGVGFQCMMVAFPYLEKGAVIMTNTELGVHQMEGIIGEIYRTLIC